MNQKIRQIGIKKLALFITLLSATIVAGTSRVSASPTTIIKPDSAIIKSTNTQIAQANLSDYAGNWAEPFIKVLIDKNIIVGYPDGTFKPDQPVTRAELQPYSIKHLNCHQSVNPVHLKTCPQIIGQPQ
jgi:hypothetical protein